MLFSVICLVTGAVLLVLFQYHRVVHISPFSTVLKGMVSAGFIAAAICPFAANDYGSADRRYCALVIIALLMGLLGDIWLDLKYVHAEGSKVYTNAGFIVFLLGHIFYDSALISRFYIRGSILYVIIPVAISLLFAVIIAFTEDVLKVKYGEYKAIVMAYSPFVMSIAAISLSLAIQNRFRVVPLNMFFAASLFFLFSDLILNGTYFGRGKDRPKDIIINHTAYYIAQYIIAFSLCFLS